MEVKTLLEYKKKLSKKPNTHILLWSMDNINIILQNCKFNPNTRGELHKLQLKAEVTLRQARVLTKTKTIKTKDSNPILGATRSRLLPTAKVCTSREDHV